MERAHALAVVAGMDSESFWGATPWEAALVVREHYSELEQLQKADDRRVALLTATIVNMAGKQARRTVRPEEFLGRADKDTPQGLSTALRQWARDLNQGNVQ